MKKFFISIGCYVILVFSLCPVLWAGEPIQVAIIPFNIHAPADLSYLRDGILDMLASRLAWGGKVMVLEKQAVKARYPKAIGSLDEISAQKLGQDLKVDYVLFGSITVLGNTSSLDAKMVAVARNMPAMAVYSQAKSLDEIIPKIDEFAETINAKIFGRTSPAATAVVPPVEPRTTRAHPERILLSGEGEETASSLNPEFIRLSGKKNRANFWKAQEFPVVMRGMQVADLNGDGQKEVVFINKTEIWIYRYKDGKLEEVKHLKGRSTYDQLSLDVGDINGNGIPEIYVSNLNSGNVDSFVLEWNGADFVPIAEHLRWYVRLTTLAGGNSAIVGQEKDIEAPFVQAIYELQWVGRKLEAGSRVPLPVSANVFNFTMADINGDKNVEILLIDENNKLKIYSLSGEKRWQSDERYGETINFVVTNPNRSKNEAEERIYLPARIIIGDLDQDGMTDLVIGRNLSTTGRWLRNFKEYTSSEMHSLSWDGLGLAENWKTRKISGAVCDYQIVDVDGKGQYELFVGIIMRTGIAPLFSGQSTIISYKLNLKPDKND